MKNTHLFIQTITFLFLLFFSFFSTGQTLLGVVKDSSSGDAVLYANISIKDKYFGTITNKEGEFVFFIPDSLINNNVEISCIGYKTTTISIKENLNKYFSIELLPQSYNLMEVTVQPDISGEQILTNAVRKFYRNYPRKTHYYKLFLSHKIYNISTKKYLRLTEAALNMQHFGFDSKKDIRITIEEIRNSINYTKLSKRKSFWNFGKIPINPVSNLMYREKGILNKSSIRKRIKSDLYKVSIVDKMVKDGTLIYVVQVKQFYNKFLGKKYRTTKFYWIIDYYVQANNWAIIKTDTKMISHLVPEMNFKDSTLTQITSTYQQYKGKYYLKNINFIFSGKDQNKLRDKKNLYRDMGSIIFNEVITDDRRIHKINRRNDFSREKSLWDVDIEYNPDFWLNYNLILDNPLGEDEIKDLEKNMPLENQFRRKNKIGNEQY